MSVRFADSDSVAFSMVVCPDAQVAKVDDRKMGRHDELSQIAAAHFPDVFYHRLRR